VTRASKAQRPSTPLWFIRRRALEQRLKEALTRRLTTVVAGPGFGKSTVLGGWAGDHFSAWYTLGPEDEALPTFATGLVGALRAAVPALSGNLVDPIVKGVDGNEAAGRFRAEAFGAGLSEELEGLLAKSLALVLDDVHEIRPAGAAARLIEELVRQAPAKLHLIISSRTNPPFGMERMRGRGEVLSIDGQMLAFSQDELAEFLSASVEEGADDLAETLHRLTGGWPAAVRLAVEALRLARAEERPLALARLSRPGGPLFAYLAEEVFAREPQSVRELFRRTALFDRFNAELCGALGVEEAAEAIRSLLARGLFLQTHEQEEWFSLHALVRDFALRSWPLEPGQVGELHRAAAAWFESHGHFAEALRSLAAAPDYPELARLLSERGTALVANGKAEIVAQLDEAIPTELRDSSIELILGEAHAVRGEGDLALECFGRAVGQEEILPAAIATRIALFHYYRDELNEAMRVLERGGTDPTDHKHLALFLAARAGIHHLRGDFVNADGDAARALELAIASQDERTLATAYTVLGFVTERDKRAAMTYLEQALEAAERAGDILQISRIRVNMGCNLLNRGLYRQALECVDIAIKFAELAGFVHQLGMGLGFRAESLLAQGRPEEAIVDLEAAREVFRREGSADIAFALVELGDIHRDLGNLAQARAAYEEGVAAAEGAGDVQNLGLGLPGLARILWTEAPDEATLVAERAVSFGEASPTFVRALLATGWIALLTEHRDRAARIADQAEAQARERQERPGLAEAVELKALSEPDPSRAVARLEEAAAMWQAMGSILGQARAELALARLSLEPGTRGRRERAERRLRALGVRTAPPLAAGLLASLPVEADVPVRIRTLGGFAVLRRGHAVSPTEWQSKKARDLLKILLARRGRPAPREFLMEALWPEEDPAKPAHRLSVALATLRAVLDPGRDFAQEEFVTADKAAIGLDLSNLPVDVEDFLAEAMAGLSMPAESQGDALDILESAETAYGGDFLEEEAYEDWAASLREEARALYVSVVGVLARHAATAREYDISARYFLRLLERDPYDEGAHFGLLSALIEAGRHGEARRRYRAYASRMKEIDVEAAPFPSRPPT
jgi:DNA-binding SARP family transcriptional activator